MIWTRHLIVIPAAMLAAATAFAATLTPDAGDFVPLYASGDEAQDTPTHYWLNALCDEPSTAAIAGAVAAAAFPAALVVIYDHRANPGLPAAQLAELALTTKQTPNIP